jgi:hypothetical protein
MLLAEAEPGVEAAVEAEAEAGARPRKVVAELELAGLASLEEAPSPLTATETPMTRATGDLIAKLDEYTEAVAGMVSPGGSTVLPDAVTRPNVRPDGSAWSAIEEDEEEEEAEAESEADGEAETDVEAEAEVAAASAASAEEELEVGLEPDEKTDAEPETDADFEAWKESRRRGVATDPEEVAEPTPMGEEAVGAETATERASELKVGEVEPAPAPAAEAGAGVGAEAEAGAGAEAETEAETEAALKIQAIQCGNVSRAEKQAEAQSVVKVQAIQRGKVSRAERVTEGSAAVRIQAVQRGKQTRARVSFCTLTRCSPLRHCRPPDP